MVSRWCGGDGKSKKVSNTQEVIKNKDKLNGRFGKRMLVRIQTKRDHTLLLLLLLLVPDEDEHVLHTTWTNGHTKKVTNFLGSSKASRGDRRRIISIVVNRRTLNRWTLNRWTENPNVRPKWANCTYCAHRQWIETLRQRPTKQQTCLSVLAIVSHFLKKK